MEINDFDQYKITLKKASEDTCKNLYMSQLENLVINFDAIKNQYLSELSPKPSDTPLSNDVLFQYDDEWYFIEFKNGLIDNRLNAEIKIKLYDSLFIFLDLLNNDIEYSRKKINYILVFNEDTLDRNKISTQFDKDEYLRCNEIPSKNSGSFADLVSMMDELSGEFGKAQFGLERYENFLFKKVQTIPKYKFDNYINQFFN